MTILGDPNQKIVLNLQNFQLDHSSTFTLSGTMTTTFIINVAKNFSLNNNSQIILSGVPPANVLFNVLGGGDFTLDHGSKLQGTLLALKANINIKNNANVTGRVIAKTVQLSSGGNVVTPVTNN